MSEYIFKLPDLGEGTVEAEIGEWHIKIGDSVREEDVVGAMMTDKAAVEVSSPVSGTVKALAGEPGDIVAVGAPLVVFETDGTAAAGQTPAAVAVETPASEPAPAPAADAPPAAPPPNRKVLTSPAIRRRARDAGIDLAGVPGSGPRGRITRADFDRFAKSGGAAAAPARATRSGTEEIKVIGLRRMIAERLSASKRSIPHFAYVEELDVTELEALRRHLNDSAAADAPKLTLLPLIGMALIRALPEFPQCNALHDEARNVIVRHNAIHLGIATQTPDGLKVPVVRHAEAMGLDELAGEIARLAAAARDNTAKRDELSGSTITLTSLGRLGGIVSTPVINAPEVAIIGVNKAVERPVVHNGQIAVRLMMNLSSSFDHRFVDGYDAAELIQRLKQLLEHPATIFIDR